METPYVIFGLGNPGAEYERTRHNVGFWLVDRLAERFGGRWTYPDPEYALSRARIRGRDVLLVKPQTYMNLSGDALRLLRQAHPVELKRMLVVCDDIALPAGQIRLRKKGSDGGQKGLRSIIDAAGSSSIPRLRLGIGDPGEQGASDYVLEAFDDEGAEAAQKMVSHGARCVETWIEHGVDTAMSRFNRRPDPPPKPADSEPDGESG
jgi:PTH1 family peptidyl-tRNA hydrolase